MFDMMQMDLPRIEKDLKGKSWLLLYRLNSCDPQITHYMACEAEANMPAPTYLIGIVKPKGEPK